MVWVGEGEVTGAKCLRPNENEEEKRRWREDGCGKRNFAGKRGKRRSKKERKADFAIGDSCRNLWAERDILDSSYSGSELVQEEDAGDFRDGWAGTAGAGRVVGH